MTWEELIERIEDKIRLERIPGKSRKRCMANFRSHKFLQSIIVKPSATGKFGAYKLICENCQNSFLFWIENTEHITLYTESLLDYSCNELIIKDII